MTHPGFAPQVVGSQNAGKSSLITAMKRVAGTQGKSEFGQG